MQPFLLPLVFMLLSGGGSRQADLFLTSVHGWDDAALNEELTSLAENLNSVRALALGRDRKVEEMGMKYDSALAAHELRIDGLEKNMGQIETKLDQMSAEVVRTGNDTVATAQAHEQRILGLEAKMQKISELEREMQKISDFEGKVAKMLELEAKVQKLSDLELKLRKISELDTMIQRISDFRAWELKITELETKSQKIAELEANMGQILEGQALTTRLDKQVEDLERTVNQVIKSSVSATDANETVQALMTAHRNSVQLQLQGIRSELTEVAEIVVELEEVRNNDGTLLWEIPNFASKVEEPGPGASAAARVFTPLLKSAPFYTARRGYKFQAELHPSGDRVLGKNYVSVFVRLVQGPYDRLLKWPYGPMVAVTLFGKEQSAGGSGGDDRLKAAVVRTIEATFNRTGPYVNDSDNRTSNRAEKREDVENGRVGWHQFVGHESLRSSNSTLLQNGALLLRIEVSVKSSIETALQEMKGSVATGLREMRSSIATGLQEVKSSLATGLLDGRRQTELISAQVDTLQVKMNSVGVKATQLEKKIQESTSRVKLLEDTPGRKIPVTLYQQPYFSGQQKTFWLDGSGACLALPIDWQEKAQSIDAYGNCVIAYSYYECHNAHYSLLTRADSRLAGTTFMHRDGKTRGNWGGIIESLKKC